MSKPRTAIRRMWGMGPNCLYRASEKRRAEIEALDGCPIYPYLVIPDTPEAATAMIDRVIADLYGALPASRCKKVRGVIRIILASALTPSK